MDLTTPLESIRGLWSTTHADQQLMKTLYVAPMGLPADQWLCPSCCVTAKKATPLILQDISPLFLHVYATLPLQPQVRHVPLPPRARGRLEEAPAPEPAPDGHHT